MTNKNEIKIFNNHEIRTKWDNDIEEYYYSIIDVISALTDSKNPRNYWKVLKTG